jgi:hypothetical protein
MLFEAIRDGRQEQHLSIQTSSGFFANGPNEEVVYIQGQVRAMVFHRPDRQYNHGLALNNIPHLRPGIVVVIILLPLGHAGTSLKL